MSKLIVAPVGDQRAAILAPVLTHPLTPTAQDVVVLLATERTSHHAGRINEELRREKESPEIRVELVTPERHQLGQRPPGEIAKARTRLVVESVFSNLKLQMRLSNHLAKTPAGLAQRIAQRLLALTLGILVNLLVGRSARALVAYDGR